MKQLNLTSSLKILSLLVCLGIALSFTACKKECPNTTPEPVSIDNPIPTVAQFGIAPTNWGDPDDWVTGTPFVDGIDLAADAGAELAHFYYSWKDLEPSQGNYNWNTSNLQILHAKSKGMQSSVALKVVDTWGLYEWPTDVTFTSFTDSALIARYQALAVNFANLYANEVDYIWIGNEIDYYFDNRRDSLADFVVFFDSIANAIHTVQPHIKVGTISSYHDASPNNRLDIISSFTNADLMGFTYYPQIMDPDANHAGDTLQNIAYFAQSTGIPFAITETAWSTKGQNGTLEGQKAFIADIFPTFQTLKNQNMEFFTVWGLYDLPPALVDDLTELTPDQRLWLKNLAFICNYGTPKEGWDTYLQTIRSL